MKKKFDAVRWMRKRRAEIDEEDRGLSWEEKRRKTHEIVSRDPIFGALFSRAVTPDQLKPLTVSEAPSIYKKDPDPSSRDRRKCPNGA